jgi:predicted LPLAT superfamily acyltransferase
MKKRRPQNEWSGKSRGGAAGYLTFVFIIKYLGVTMAYVLLSFVVIYYIPFAPGATASVWFYSRKILGKGVLSSLIFIYKSFFSLGVALIDKTAASAGMYNQFKFDFHEPGEVKDVLNSSTGAVILGAHFGNWEIGAPYFDKYGKRMRVVMVDSEYQKIKQILETQKKVETFTVIPVKEGSLSHIFEIRDALEEGAYIAIQGDRINAGGRGVEMEFMGSKAMFPVGPFVIAARFDVPVVFYYAIRTGYKRYLFHFELCKMESGPGYKRGEKAIMESYVKGLERVVRRAPEQWFNYFKFWK